MHFIENKTQSLVEEALKPEAGKLFPVLIRIFGLHNLDLAEAVVQDTLSKALEQWQAQIPANSTNLLFTIAKDPVLDAIRRELPTRKFAKDITLLLESEHSLVTTVDQLLNENEIADNQLRMLFACCHPQTNEELQLTLVLKALSGFSTAEMAKAFGCSEETIAERLHRARQLFREEDVPFELPETHQLAERLDDVLTIIQRIFNEGYSSTRHTNLIRHDLMEEAMRLAKMLADHPMTNHLNVLALMALMCFYAARIPGQLDAEGNILLLRYQNRSLWNRELIWFGKGCLDAAAEGGELSRYHLEAGIAFEHSNAESYDLTDWDNILYLYSLLYQLFPAPEVALNRAIVIGEVEGAAAGMQAIQEIEELTSLKNHYLLPATLGEFCMQLGQTELARKYLNEALNLTQSEPEKRLLQIKLKSIA